MANKKEENGVPVVTLKNGVTVANFCSEETTVFTDGNILEGCEHGRAKSLTPRHKVVSGAGRKGTMDLHTVYDAHPAIVEEVKLLENDGNIDVILVTVPVMEALQSFGVDLSKSKVRTKCFDKTAAGTVRIDQFGSGLKKAAEPVSV